MDAPKNGEDRYGLRYAQFVVPLVKSVQELSKKSEALEEENKQLRKDVTEIKEMMTKLINSQSVTTNGVNNTNVSISGAYLVQNAPNPFTSSTIIRYHLPQGATSAKVVIANAKGQLLKTASLNGKGDGQVTLDAGMLAAGSYTYSLWIEGKQVDTKQMIIQK